MRGEFVECTRGKTRSDRRGRVTHRRGKEERECVGAFQRVWLGGPRNSARFFDEKGLRAAWTRGDKLMTEAQQRDCRRCRDVWRVPTTDASKDAGIIRDIVGVCRKGPFEEGFGQNGDKRMAAMNGFATRRRGSIEADAKGAFESFERQAFADVFGQCDERYFESAAEFFEARAEACKGPTSKTFDVVTSTDGGEGLVPFG